MTLGLSAPETQIAVGKAEARRLRQFLGRQKKTAPVVGEMRRGALRKGERAV